MTTIDPNLYLKNQPKTQKQTGNSALGKDDFMKILIAQLQNQDPSKPMEDKEFIAQMAQFSSLEQMTNMSKSMEAFMQMNQKNAILQYSQMIGKEVSWETVEPIVNKDGVQIGEKELKGVGVVKAVYQKGTELTVELADGKKVLVNSIVKVNNPTVPVETPKETTKVPETPDAEQELPPSDSTETP